MTKAQLKQLVKEAIQEMTTVSIDQLKDYFSKNPNQIEIKAHLSGDSEVMGGEYMGRELTEDEIEELNDDEDFKSNIKNAKGITHHDAAFGESKGFTKSKLRAMIKEVMDDIDVTDLKSMNQSGDDSANPTSPMGLVVDSSKVHFFDDMGNDAQLRGFIKKHKKFETANVEFDHNTNKYRMINGGKPNALVAIE